MGKLRHGVAKWSLGALAAGCAFAASGCSSGVPSDAVASVDGTAISKATLDHWAHIQFATGYDSSGQQPVPAGAIPDPPAYNACIAYLRREHQIEIGNPHRSFSTPSLKHECQVNERLVREHVQNVLIVFEWFLKSAAEDGIEVSDKAIRARYARFSGERFRNPGELQRFLTNTGSTLDDELLRMKMDMLGIGLDQKEIARLGGLKTKAQQQGYERWSDGLIKKWIAKTECRKGYVVANCKGYKGSLAPDPRI